jgi:catechol-2,3-dioxygenase
VPALVPPSSPTLHGQNLNSKDNPKKNMNTYPKTFSHVGISVPKIEEAVKFYEEVMGWYTIMKPTVVKE